MAKKLFKNYEFELDKNQGKIISAFVKQALKQMYTNDKLIREVKVFESIQNKLNEVPGKIKFTKEEKTQLVYQLNENIKYLKKKTDKSWFITKWFYRNMYLQYMSIVSMFEE